MEAESAKLKALQFEVDTEVTNKFQSIQVYNERYGIVNICSL